MGASLALAGVSACTRQPERRIVPYVRQPGGKDVQGRPLFYATSMPHGGMAMPLLAENHMGRPTHMEGNPEHPGSLGGTDVFGQASVLGLYDPDRSKSVLYRGELRTWSDFVAAILTSRAPNASSSGTGFCSTHFIAVAVGSDRADSGGVSAIKVAPVGRRVRRRPGRRADASADLPFRQGRHRRLPRLGLPRYGREHGPVLEGLLVAAPDRRLKANRLYVIEPVPDMTGAKAEHRLAMKARDVYAFGESLAGAVGAGTAVAAAGDAARWVEARLSDLQHRGQESVSRGRRAPAGGSAPSGP